MATNWQRFCYDRRVGDEDRRQVYSLDYFDGGGRERRSAAQPCRRSAPERRRNWVRAGRYVSVYCAWPEGSGAAPSPIQP